MTYMHIATVNWDALENDDTREWVESQWCEDFFVLVTDGDQSLQQDIDRTPLALEQVLTDCSPNEDIVLADEMETPDGFMAGKSYWRHPMLTRNVE